MGVDLTRRGPRDALEVDRTDMHRHSEIGLKLKQQAGLAILVSAVDHPVGSDVILADLLQAGEFGLAATKQGACRR